MVTRLVTSEPEAGRAHLADSEAAAPASGMRSRPPTGRAAVRPIPGPHARPAAPDRSRFVAVAAVRPSRVLDAASMRAYLAATRDRALKRRGTPADFSDYDPPGFVEYEPPPKPPEFAPPDPVADTLIHPGLGLGLVAVPPPPDDTPSHEVRGIGGSRVRIIARASVPSIVPQQRRIAGQSPDRRASRIAAADIRWMVAKASAQVPAPEAPPRPSSDPQSGPAGEPRTALADAVQAVRAAIAEAPPADVAGSASDVAALASGPGVAALAPAPDVAAVGSAPDVAAVGSAPDPTAPGIAAGETPVVPPGMVPGVDSDRALDGVEADGQSDSRGNHGADRETPGRSGAAVDGSGSPVRKKGFVRRSWLPLTVALTSAFVAATVYLWATDPPALDGLGRWGGAGAAPAAQQAAPEKQLPAERPSGVTEAWANAPTNPNPFGTAAAVLQGAPTRVKIPSIGVDTSLESLHLDKTGALTPPQDFAKAGWYADGTAPGDNGPAVIAGHVDSYRGPAVFYKLREMVPGDGIDVVRGGQTVHFTVVTTGWYAKTKFPTDKVYGPTPDRQLRLITCGGVFDHTLRSYKDNFVVYAVAG